MPSNIWLWVGFNVFVLGMIALDLDVFHRKAHVVTKKEAAIWTGVWIALVLIFSAEILLARPKTAHSKTDNGIGSSRKTSWRAPNVCDRVRRTVQTVQAVQSEKNWGSNGQTIILKEMRLCFSSI
jgi:hypothetical protein